MVSILIRKINHGETQERTHMDDTIKWGFTRQTGLDSEPGTYYINGVLLSVKGKHDYPVDPSSHQGGALRFLPPNENWDMSKTWHTQLTEAVLDTTSSRLRALTSLPGVGHQIQNTLSPASAYVVELAIGESSTHRYKLKLDTGTDNSWIIHPGYELFDEDANVYAGGRSVNHTFYEPGEEEQTYGSFEVLTRWRSIVSGHLHECVWTAELESQLAPISFGMRFGVADRLSLHLSYSQFDGVLSLGLPSNSSDPNPQNLLDRLHAEGIIKNKIFHLDLKFQRYRVLTLDYIPPNTELTWIPIIPGSQQWLIECHAIGWGIDLENPDFKQLTLSPPLPVLLDSATSHCYFPDQVVSFVHIHVEGVRTPYGYDIPSKRTRQSRHNSLWIKLGHEWMKWPFGTLFGQKSGIYESLTLLQSFMHSRLYSYGDTFPHAIIGSAFFENMDIYFDATYPNPSVAFSI